ncbi:hypothetical protein PENSPDRAFT_191315 [Peniophora sp. CONT]|nr:hypothetical protein PENSPDRAFT_191315 [Peniophora sp. CONT]
MLSHITLSQTRTVSKPVALWQVRLNHLPRTGLRLGFGVWSFSGLLCSIVGCTRTVNDDNRQTADMGSELQGALEPSESIKLSIDNVTVPVEAPL